MPGYISPLRRQQADDTRRRVVRAAADAFATAGYTATTLRVIAEKADVSVETVQATGAKRDLLVAAFNELFTGDAAEQEFADRPAVAAILRDDDGRRILRRLAHLLARANAEIADLWQVLTASASNDPEVAAYLDRLQHRAREQTARVVSGLIGRSLITPRRSATRTADLMWNAQSPDAYLRLVRQAGWSPRAYADALADSFIEICSGP